MNEIKNPAISLIIPCRNCLCFLKECLASLENQTFRNFEIVVVDNGSDEKIVNEKIKVIREDKNTGYAAGVNKGIINSKGNLIVVLNSDLTFDKNFLNEIYEQFNSRKIQVAALHVKDRNGIRTESQGLYLTQFLRSKNSKTANNILGPAGAAFAFDRTILEKIKTKHGLLYDERFFFLWEDVELALRLKKNNIETTVLKNAICYHHGNSTKSSYFYKQYLSMRNRFYIIRDYYPDYWIRYWHVALFYDMPRFLFFLLFNPFRSKLF